MINKAFYCDLHLGRWPVWIKYFPVLCVVFLCLLSNLAFGQEDEGAGIEELFSKDQSRIEEETKTEADAEATKALEINNVSDLGKLSEFSDVAVIQRRFLPRTGRFEIFGGPNLILNDAFFTSLGLSTRAAYYFQERYGLEFVGQFSSTSERAVTKDLRDLRGVTTTSLITPRNYFGLDFKWTPIYGKMTWFNRRITPFDLYFSVGAGSTTTNQGDSAPTLHLATGQAFALTKGMAFRWDFSWNFFNATSKVSGSSGASIYNNLFIMIGMSFFIPEATYR
jgi:outer membrane beta-barrel protein